MKEGYWLRASLSRNQDGKLEDGLLTELSPQLDSSDSYDRAATRTRPHDNKGVKHATFDLRPSTFDLRLTSLFELLSQR